MKPHAITLRALHRQPKLSAAWEGERVRIWSGEHLLWWRAEGRGYTAYEEEAGVYDFADAYKRTSHCGDEKRIVFVEADPPQKRTAADEDDARADHAMEKRKDRELEESFERGDR